MEEEEEGEASEGKKEPAAGAIEQGRIWFFYRPKVRQCSRLLCLAACCPRPWLVWLPQIHTCWLVSTTCYLHC